MSKLNQIIAVANGTKSQAESELTKIHHLLQKAELLTGLSRTYQPKDDEGEQFPPEKKNVQYTANRGIKEASSVLAKLFDVVAAQDNTNCVAKADIVVDGTAVLKNVPVTHLLFLEKKLVDLHTFCEKLPTLDPAENWSFDNSIDCFRSEPSQTNKSKKVQKVLVKYEATKEHPAQTEMVTEDVTVGTYTKVSFSGGIPVTKKNQMVERVRKLQEAVKFAREEANMMEVADLKTGKSILDYIFEPLGS